MHTPPPSKATGPIPLPDAINISRIEELETLFEECSRLGRVVFDGSEVHDLDSRGFEYLVNGVEQLNLDGVSTEIENPSEPLRQAREALRQSQRLPFTQDCETAPETELPINLTDALLDVGLVNDVDLNICSNEATAKGIGLKRALVDAKIVTEDDLAYVYGRQHQLPVVAPLAAGILDVRIEHGVPTNDLRRHGVLPFLVMEDVMAVAVEDPSNVYAVDLVRRSTTLRVVASVATPSEIQAGLDLLQRSASKALNDTQTRVEDSVSAAERLDKTLMNALIEGASDIHIEPGENSYLIRYRVDGRLREVEHVNPDQGSSLVARVKVVADCDISEKRLPQDGRYHFKSGSRDVDLRINTLPTVYGEKAVMRILDRTEQSPKLDVFGFSGRDLDVLRESIKESHGMVLVTGPTGSGKTTTLYSVLAEIVTPEINVSTVENPVERSLDNVNQTQVNPKAGLKFSTCLRALLRQDPDVIMIGEIRDHETAEIAVEAALTGHLVLATLHTNDAPSAATRLIQMGIEPFLVSATLRLAMAQRLVRRLCDSCKTPVVHPREVLEKFARAGLNPSAQHYAASGCPACCGTGYSGRRGAFEIMEATQEVRDLIARNPTSDETAELAYTQGMTSLLQDCIRRVNDGVTTLEEALRNGGVE